MRALDEIVSSVLSASGLPTASRRRELERELRCHLEDVMDELRLSGCPDARIEEMVRARFGDTRDVARSFADAYKTDRTVVQGAICLGLLFLCGAAVAVIVSLGQAYAALVIGLSLGRAFSRLPWELCGVAALTLGYLGTYVLQVRFDRWRTARSVGFAVVSFGSLCFAVGLLPPSHRLGPAVAFLCAVSARLFEGRKPRWLFMFGAAAPVLLAWMISGPLTGNGRLGPWQMLALVCFNVTAACRVLAWLVRRFERGTQLHSSIPEPGS